jgi:hypothetical protein
MVLTPGREIGTTIDLRDHAAKMGHGRHIPIHSELRDRSSLSGNIIKSERGGAITPLALSFGLGAPIGPWGLMVVRHILAAALSLRELPALFTRQADHCVTFSCWQGTGRSKLRSGTSMAIAMLNGGSYH